MATNKDSDFRLLIVDDNEAIHDDLRKILLPPQLDSELAEDEALLFGKSTTREVEFAIDSAFQGQEGLGLVEQAQASGSRYALAFVDIRMPPGWDGIETILHLWEKDPALQIVICTAYSDYNWREIALRLGISENFVILKKPFDPIEVTQLAHALTTKWKSSLQAQLRMDELDRMVDERTTQLRLTIKELEDAKELAEITALQDPLTKLPNRRLLQTRLPLALQQSQHKDRYLCALLYLDMDRFKVVNDSLGHQAGDELLIDVAGRLESCLRDHSETRPGCHDVVARLGGDEFAVFLDDIRDVADALRVAQRINAALAVPFQLRGKEIATSVSIGIATTQSGYTSGESMLRDADTAMYRAKSGGRGCCVLFDKSMHLYAVERLQKESELRDALKRNEFFLCYQPIASIMTGEIEGFEALLRWQSPTRGLVNPADFITLCEETGLIIPLGAWILREACQQMRRWHDEFGTDFGLNVSVNLSARQFQQPDLVSTIECALREAGIGGHSLRLEITESVTMEDPERTALMLSELQKLGIRISIDDFGTGYSSLNYLHHFAVDTLKIDRYFIAKMSHKGGNSNIVRTIVSLAHNLNMKVVAEGLETLGQIDTLKRMQCDLGQGYYFSYPISAEEIGSLLRANPDFRLMPQSKVFGS